MKFETEPRKYEVKLIYTIDDGNKDEDRAKRESIARLMRCDIVEMKSISRKRTDQQNKALHVWYSLIAEELNNAGYDIRKTIRDGVEIPWSSVSVKEYLWRPVQEAYLKKHSTTELKTTDIDKIFDIINRHIGERTGVHVPFPNVEQT